MKANQSIKLNNEGYVQVVGGIVALLIAIIIGVMLYFAVTESNTAFDDSISITTTTDISSVAFTNYTSPGGAQAGSNFTGVTIQVEYSIGSVTNITCWDQVSVLSYAETAETDYHINGDRLTIIAGQVSNFTQLNVTYVSQIASAEGDNTAVAQNVFALMPIIALVVVAAVLLGIVLVFGRGRKGGGL